MFKVCPSCRKDYLLSASVCSDCGVALELPQPAPVPARGREREEWVAIQRGGPWELRELAERLQAAGISSRIDSIPPGRPLDGPAGDTKNGNAGWTIQLGLYVRSGDAHAARGTTEEFTASRLSDLPPESPPSDPALCPACGEPLAEDAASCASCGLEFPG